MAPSIGTSRYLRMRRSMSGNSVVATERLIEAARIQILSWERQPPREPARCMASAMRVSVVTKGPGKPWTTRFEATCRTL